MQNAIIINLDKCNGCGACVGVCPESALYIQGSKAVWDRTPANPCSFCEACVGECPELAISIEPRWEHKIEGLEWIVIKKVNTLVYPVLGGISGVN